MNTQLRDLFPENISDEAAFYLVTFFMNIAWELDSCYFAQVKRYINDNIPSDLSKHLQDENQQK